MWDLKKRTFAFAVTVGKLIYDLPETPTNRVYIGQLIRASCPVGANYRAARRAKSQADFINKRKIVEEETDESVYFLELLAIFNPVFSTRIDALVNEGTEILKIIVTSINTSRAKLNK